MSSDYFYSNTNASGAPGERGGEYRPDNLEAEVEQSALTRLSFAMSLIRRGVEAALGYVPGDETVAPREGEVSLRATEAEADMERIVPISAKRDQAGQGPSAQTTAVDYGQGAAPAVNTQESMLAAARAAAAQIYDGEASGALPPRIDADLAEAINFPATGSAVVELRPEVTPTAVPDHNQLVA